MIDKQTLFRIFTETNKKLKLDLVPRECFNEAKKYFHYKEILAITGVRRCGKTSLMYSLMQYLINDKKKKVENLLYLNFEDERLAFIQPEDLEQIKEWFLEYSGAKGKLYFFLDEIQNVPLWEKWLSRSYEDVKYVVSGSNSTLLSSELASAITGRYIELSVYPFSFREFVIFKDSELLDIKKVYTLENTVRLKKLLKQYIQLGGFPEVLLHRKMKLLPQYYQTILLKDIISRYNIKHKNYLDKLSLFLVSNLGKLTSYNSLDKNYPLGINTIATYMDYMEKCFLLFFVNKFDYSLRKQNANPRKVYAIDTALAKSVSFNFSIDIGRVYENLVFIEFKRRGEEVFYFRGQGECDFLVKKGIKIKQAVQVCYELTETNRKREINGLLEVMKKYHLKEGIIITSDLFDDEIIEEMKIKYLPLWLWLLFSNK